MSMLPELFDTTETDEMWEDKFFRTLHMKDDEVEVVPPAVKPRYVRSFQITGRVIGRNYSYPLQFDPLLQERNDHA